jgi:transcriptional repressor NrdR
MKCPYCGTDEDRVIDSRPARDGRAIRRRRECSKCGNRFTTYEAPEVQVVLVAKADSSREPFDRNKVRRGVMVACNKRPVQPEQIERITQRVEQRASSTAETGEVSTALIGQWILEELAGVDEVAYVRFASVFKRYESLDEFLDELQRLRLGAAPPSQSD